MQDFSYDPFDPAVMADPLPYYRVLRDEHPVYYIDKWDTYALSRFADIWGVLEINDGTFVASEGTLPAATVLAQRNDGPVPDPPLHPMPFHANFDAPVYDSVRRCTASQFRPKSVATLADRIRTLANERLDDLLPRGTFDLTQDYGGIVAASVVCELVGLPADLAPEVLATVNAGSLAEPGSGVEVANARPGYLEYLTPIVQRRRADGAGGALPIADNLIAYRLPDGSAFTDTEAAVQMLGVFIGGTETVPKIVAHGLWELERPDQMAAVRTDLEANVPIAREEMIRYCAPAQWFARTVRKPFTIHGTTIEPGQRIITLLASANRDEREYTDPDEFVWNRPIERLLAFGRGQHFCLGVHLARLEIAIMVTEWLKRVPDWRIVSEAASRPPSSFQWGWNTVPVEV
jgi:cytochrome P450